MPDTQIDSIELAEAKSRLWSEKQRTQRLSDQIDELQSQLTAMQEAQRNYSAAVIGLQKAAVWPRQVLRRLRRRVGLVRREPQLVPTPQEFQEFPKATDRSSARPGHKCIQKILFVSGEPDTPGAQYRCERNADACARAGYEARVVSCGDVGPNDIEWADAAIIWRSEYSDHVRIMIGLLRDAGKPAIFDVDDLVFLPQLARVEFLDGIRLSGATEARIEQVFHNMRATMMACDMALSTTEELAHQMRVQDQRVAQVMPNVFNEKTLLAARHAVRQRKKIGNDAFVRVGYAAGSRTHQRDFKIVAPALLRILRDIPNVRLVLFENKSLGLPLLLLNEFPEFSAYSDRVEWLDFVPLDELPASMATFDVSIAPLTVGDAFCECKSEVKFIEAALAGVPSIVSPMGTMRRVIVHGENGFFASTEQDWEDNLRLLIGDKARRAKVGATALLSVLWRFSVDRQAQIFADLFKSLEHEVRGAARGRSLISRAAGNYQRELPEIPAAEVIFEHDNLGIARTTVIITSFNYAKYVIDALESVYGQTLNILDMVIVDDGSTDNSVDLIVGWAKRNVERFNRFLVLKSVSNVGLGGARNIGMAAAETTFCLHLDADNRLLPDAAEKLMKAIDETGAAYAYPISRQIDEHGNIEHEMALLGDKPFYSLRLIPGNYIDAMAMVSKAAWVAAGGYYVNRDAMGWEDYDLWCNLAELELGGTQVPEILAEYRRHTSSMTNGVTEQVDHKERVVSFVQSRHPWIKLTAPNATQRL